MSIEVFFRKGYDANGFWNPTFQKPFIHLPTLWQNSIDELSAKPEIKLGDVEFFTFRLDETSLHEILHGRYGLTDEQIGRIVAWLREILLYGEDI